MASHVINDELWFVYLDDDHAWSVGKLGTDWLSKQEKQLLPSTCCYSMLELSYVYNEGQLVGVSRSDVLVQEFDVLGYRWMIYDCVGQIENW